MNTGEFKPYIRIVDDDPMQRKALRFLLECEGYSVWEFDCGRDFLTNDQPSVPGCVIMDLQMPGMDGLTVQKELVGRRYRRSIVFLSAHGDLKKAVSAMKMGSHDFLEKPVDGDVLLECIKKLMHEEEVLFRLGMPLSQALEWFSLLSDRERIIANLLAGSLNKTQVAQRLNLSEKTIDNHCQSIYKKLHIHSNAELVEIHRLYQQAQMENS